MSLKKVFHSYDEITAYLQQIFRFTAILQQKGVTMWNDM